MYFFIFLGERVGEIFFIKYKTRALILILQSIFSLKNLSHSQIKFILVTLKNNKFPKFEGFKPKKKNENEEKSI